MVPGGPDGEHRGPACEHGAVLSVDEARALVLEQVTPLASERVALTAALGRVLAEGIVAAGDVPPFDNSAMDGFAARAGDAERRLAIAGESRAGEPFGGVLRDGEVVRISTGAMVPAGAEAVVMVERTTEHGDGTVTLHQAAAPAQNIRGAGEDVTAGTEVLRPGTRLGAAELGVASTCGVAELACARRPRVAILATGDELVAPGNPLGPGQIHDSNALTLASLVQQDGGEVVRSLRVADDPRATRDAVAAGLQDVDVLLLSGGVSVGPHDHVKPALDHHGVREVFWRVALRPGKPTWFGTHGDTLVLGLPGNPVSTMVTYLLFGRPALKLLQGADPHAPHLILPLTTAVDRTPQRDEMVRVTIDAHGATPTGHQGSHRLTSMLGADGLARVPAGEGRLEAGDPVAIERL
jgi:molybdopterin molybdotransferase